MTLDSTYKETAGFANVTVHIIPQFDIQAGGRYSKNEQTAFEALSGLLIGPPQAFSTPSSGHVWTYSFAPRWHIDADNMVYARLATGFRPGGPNALPPVAPPDVPRSYGADKTTNIELGVKSTLLEGLLSIDASVFHVDWTDIQLLERVDSFGINGNGGKAKSQGFEWTVRICARAWPDAAMVRGVHGREIDHAGAGRAWQYRRSDCPIAPKWGTSLDGEYDCGRVRRLQILCRCDLELCGQPEEPISAATWPETEQFSLAELRYVRRSARP